MQSRKSAFQAALLVIALIGAAVATTISAPAQMQDQIYGSQLMTPEERSAYRDRMRSAKTAEEREAIRAENHKKMSERAKERGVTLPDEPPAAGMGRGMGPGGMGQGMGPGGGMGKGMGPGGGMGPGSGTGPGGGARP